MNAAKSTDVLARALIFLLFLLISILVLAPFYFMIISSFKPSIEIFRYGINSKIQIDIMSMDNYFKLFTAKDGVYLLWFKNSILITAIFTVLSLFFSSLVGYGLGAYDFKGKNLIFTIVIAVMMVPVEIVLLPLYKLTISLHIMDSYAGVILPFLVSPFAVFFFKQYASSIPKDYIDAGRIDGSNEFGIYFKIMVPLMIPAFGAMTILQAMNSWNNFLWPLIVLKTSEKFTIPIGLSALVNVTGRSNFEMLFTGSVVSVIPIVLVFLFNQKAFISGLTVGGVKG